MIYYICLLFDFGAYMNLIRKIWHFFGLYQSHKVRLLHCAVLIFVVAQIIISNWMKGTKSSVIPPVDWTYFFTWAHVTIGFCLFFITLILIVVCFHERGMRYFYPYLWGDVVPFKNDIKQLMKLKLPDSTPKGLASVVQGLGLGALSIVIISGMVWFFLWLQHSPSALEARSIHKSLTVLIEIYIYGHGGFGLIHFVLWYKKSKNSHQ
ncbi:cytochrome b/b6 domain-containing protein [Morganella morganii]|uniref:cytochrome b/b6 domain-containing protein n=1 Tax=Morganella morganii TaxID=582 RepID=UPI0030BA1A06